MAYDEVLVLMPHDATLAVDTRELILTVDNDTFPVRDKKRERYAAVLDKKL